MVLGRYTMEEMGIQDEKWCILLEKNFQIYPQLIIRLTEQKTFVWKWKIVYNVILPIFSIKTKKKCNKIQKHSQNLIFQVVVHHA